MFETILWSKLMMRTNRVSVLRWWVGEESGVTWTWATAPYRIITQCHCQPILPSEKLTIQRIYSPGKCTYAKCFHALVRNLTVTMNSKHMFNMYWYKNFCRTRTKRYLITSRTRVKRVSQIHHRTILLISIPCTGMQTTGIGWKPSGKLTPLIKMQTRKDTVSYQLSLQH